MKLVLNIDNDWKALDIKNVDIVLHKAFADLEDPASIESAYTLNVKLPFTETNINILGDIYRLDFRRVTTNITFDQRQKYKFKLLNEEEIIYEGTFVLDSISICADSNENQFNVTLFDEMYNVLTRLDYTLGEPADSWEDLPASYPSDKLCNITAFDTQLTSKSVTNSWKYGCTFTDAIHKTDGEYDYYLSVGYTPETIANVIGFLPTWKKADNFDYTRIALPDLDGKTVTNNLTFRELYDQYPEEFPEFTLETWKSHNCKPYIYYHNYVEFLICEIYRTTGYKVNLTDRDFFQIGNPYWANLIRTLNYVSVAEENEFTYDFTYLQSDDVLFTNAVRNKQDASMSLMSYQTDASNKIENLTRIYLDHNNLHVGGKYRVKWAANANVLLEIDKDQVFPLERKVRLNRGLDLKAEYTIGFYDASNNLITTKNYEQNIVSDNSWWLDENLPDMITVDGYKYDWRTIYFNTPIPYAVLPTNEDSIYYVDSTSHTDDMTADTQMGMIVKKPNTFINIGFELDLDDTEISSLISGHVAYYRVTPVFTPSVKHAVNDYFEPVTYFETMRLSLHNFEGGLLSYNKGQISLHNLLGADTNILTSFTDFLKTFNLVCQMDYKTRTIDIFNRGEYFTKFIDKDGNTDASKGWRDNVENWTDYIDFSEVIDTTEITSQYKDIVYTYEQRDDYYNTTCRNDLNLENHSMKVELPFTANTETYSYLPGQYNSCYTNLKEFAIDFFYDYMKIPAIAPHTKKYPLYVDVDQDGNSLEEVSGQLLFRNWSDLPYTWFKEGQNNSLVWVSDRSDFEREQNMDQHLMFRNAYKDNYSFASYSTSYPAVGYYFYGNTSDTDSYEKLVSNMNDIYSSEWSNLGCGYTGSNKVNTLYSVFHEKWNELLYGEGNKLVQATLHVPLHVYKNFRFNHLAAIENNLYLVLSIDEYDFRNTVMRVKLLQINNYNVLNNMDRDWKDREYLVVSPKLLALPRVASTVPVDIIASEPGTISTADGKAPTQIDRPDWIGTLSLDASTFTQGVTTVNMTYTTNSQYPVTQDIMRKTLFASLDSSNLEQYVSVTNVPEEDITDTLVVTPTTYLSPNENGQQVTVVYDVTSVTRPSASLTVPHLNVLTNITIAPASKTAPNKWIITLYGLSTEGTAGETMTVNFSNTFGNTASSTITRDVKPFEHITELTTYNGNTGNFWTWDYTSIEELATGCRAESEFAFDIRTNYNAEISPFGLTMYDSRLEEYCYNTKCDIWLFDETDPDNPVKYGPDDTVSLSSNKIYKFRFTYHRRYLSNDVTYNGFLHVRCVDSHGDSYLHPIRITANIRNNTL